jgi:hypothetical protein
MKREKGMKKRARTKKNLLLAAVLMVLCGIGFAEGAAGSPAKAASAEIRLSVTPGANWLTTMWAGPIPIRKAPQFAAWIETADGSFVKTLAVTARSGKNEWRSASPEGRPEALPTWLHSAGSSGGALDAMSSATPKGGVSVSISPEGLIAGTGYVARFEVNTSFDYNDAWPKNAKAGAKNYSGVNGQPSLVYEARFVAGAAGSIELKPVGQGSVDGSSGAVTPGLAGLTSALSIVGRVMIDIQ